MQILATHCPSTATGQAQQECSSILVERLPMTSSEAESRGRLLAFQWAPYCLPVLCYTDTFIAHIVCSAPTALLCTGTGEHADSAAQQ